MLPGMGAVFPTPFAVSVSCWFAWELGLVVGVALRRWLPALDTPAPVAFAVTGLVVLWVGLAVRVWTVLTLGGSFSTFVQVDAGQAVVSRGPYRWVRHPSYTGLLLIALGFGLGAGNWLSLAVCAVVPLLGLLPRMAVEEAELTRVLGDRYRSYQRTTRRLVPGLW
jgi:protein-S-isoprenylcysteine O-methyltransferase Ste14